VLLCNVVRDREEKHDRMPMILSISRGAADDTTTTCAGGKVRP